MRREAKKRRCGDCSVCCTIVGVLALDKPPGKPCAHISGKGCSIWGKKGFPSECKKFDCAWRAGAIGLERPDKCGYIVWSDKQFIIFDECWPGAAKEVLMRRPQITEHDGGNRRIILRWAGYE